MTARCRVPGGQERGSADVLGLVLIFPAILALAILVLWLGRQVEATSEVQTASEAAAQAAARQRSPAEGVAAARRTADLMLANSNACAGAATVTLDAAMWAPGGRVTVTVRCSPRRDDLALAGPPARQVVATATATIDPYRAAIGAP